MSDPRQTSLDHSSACVQTALHQLAMQLPTHATQWWVALSGGVDSCVLLQQLAEYQNQRPDVELAAIHVNHGLSPNADRWTEYCKLLCQKLGVALEVKRVAIEHQSRHGIEQLARQARWQALFDVAKPDDVIWLGHHQDDQVETLLLKLLRGAGVRGAAAMQGFSTQQSRYLLRPLLELPKQRLLDIARQSALQWVDDESNENTDFSRNYLRQDVLPLLESQWPGYRSALSRFTEHMQQTQRLLEQLAEQDWQQLNCDGAIVLSALQKLDADRQINVLRFWMSQRAHYLPNAKALQQLIEQIQKATSDMRIQLDWGQWRIQQSGDCLHLMESLAADTPEFHLSWQDFPNPLVIEPLQQQLFVRFVSANANDPSINSGVRPPKENEKIVVCSRMGGERCWPEGRNKSTQLKKIYQELSIPVWQRNRIPLVFYNDELVAAVGLFYDQRFVSNDQQAIQFELVDNLNSSNKQE